MLSLKNAKMDPMTRELFNQLHRDPCQGKLEASLYQRLLGNLLFPNTAHRENKEMG